MANFAGQGTTVNLANIFEDLEDEIKMIGWSKARLFARLRKLEDSKQLKHDWYEDEYCPTTNTLAAKRETISTDISLTYAFRFRKYEILRIANSVVRVTTVDATGKILTIASVGGTTIGAAGNSHSAGAVVIGLHVGQVEGADPQDGIQTTPTKKFNYLEQFEDKLDITDVRKAVDGPGGNEKTRQWTKAMLEHAQRMENAFVYGYRQAPAASTPALVGGLWDWITTNVYKVVSDTAGVATILTEVKFEEYVGKCFEAGGEPNLVVTNVVGMRALNAWYRSYYKIDNKPKGSVGVHTTHIVTSFGKLEILLDPLLKPQAQAMFQADMALMPGVILVLDMKRLGVSYLREEGSTRRVPLARTGSATSDMLRSICTLVRKSESAHAILRNFSQGA